MQALRNTINEIAQFRQEDSTWREYSIHLSEQDPNQDSFQFLQTAVLDGNELAITRELKYIGIQFELHRYMIARIMLGDPLLDVIDALNQRLASLRQSFPNITGLWPQDPRWQLYATALSRKTDEELFELSKLFERLRVSPDRTTTDLDLVSNELLKLGIQPRRHRLMAARSLLGDPSEDVIGIIPRRRIFILCIDGGGIRGIVPSIIMQAIQRVYTAQGGQAQNIFQERFQMVCGTSTGGLIGVGTALLDQTPDQMLNLYKTNARRLFHPSITAQLKMVLRKGYQHRPSALKNVIRGLTNDGQRTMHDVGAGQNPNVFVVAIPKISPKRPHLFCNYTTTPPTANRYDRSLPRVKLLDALLATSAAPSYFPGHEVDGVIYMDGGVGYNNPTHLAYLEIAHLFPTTPSLEYEYNFISLGTGRRRDPRDYREHYLDHIDLLKDVATDTQVVHERMIQLQKDAGNVLYDRIDFTLERDIALDERDIGTLDQLETGVRELCNPLNGVVNGYVQECRNAGDILDNSTAHKINRIVQEIRFHYP